MKSLGIAIPTIGLNIKCLEACLDSVINQTISFNEVVLFDNTVDQNLSILINKRFHKNIRIVQSKGQLKACDSWNAAVRTLSSDRVMLLGDDDVLDSNFVETYIKNYTSLSCPVLLPFRIIDEQGRFIRELSWKKGHISPELFIKLRLEGRIHIRIGGVVFSAEDFESVGGIIESGFENLWFVDDLLWITLALKANAIRVADEVCWSYREISNWAGGVYDIEVIEHSLPKIIEKYTNICARFNLDKEALEYLVTETEKKVVKLWLMRSVLPNLKDSNYQEAFLIIKNFLGLKLKSSLKLYGILILLKIFKKFCSSKIRILKKLLREIIRPFKRILLARIVDKPMDNYYFKKYETRVEQEDVRR